MEKQRFLFVYDYEAGGVWGLIAAENAARITAACPELTLISERPDWMGDDQFVQIELEPFPLHGEGQGWGCSRRLR